MLPSIIGTSVINQSYTPPSSTSNLWEGKALAQINVDPQEKEALAEALKLDNQDAITIIEAADLDSKETYFNDANVQKELLEGVMTGTLRADAIITAMQTYDNSLSAADSYHIWQKNSSSFYGALESYPEKLLALKFLQVDSTYPLSNAMSEYQQCHIAQIVADVVANDSTAPASAFILPLLPYFDNATITKESTMKMAISLIKVEGILADENFQLFIANIINYSNFDSDNNTNAQFLQAIVGRFINTAQNIIFPEVKMAMLSALNTGKFNSAITNDQIAEFRTLLEEPIAIATAAEIATATAVPEERTEDLGETINALKRTLTSTGGKLILGILFTFIAAVLIKKSNLIPVIIPTNTIIEAAKNNLDIATSDFNAAQNALDVAKSKLSKANADFYNAVLNSFSESIIDFIQWRKT